LEAIMPEQAASAGEREPRGTLSIRTLCVPADTNQHGDIFGGWHLGEMDIAGGIFAHTLAKGRTATVAVDAMMFKKPVRVGDVICTYADLILIGTTSIAVPVEAWAIPRNETKQQLVTEGNFTYVAIDETGRRKVPA
jgi:acyl-CoA thioesterase YciA